MKKKQFSVIEIIFIFILICTVIALNSIYLEITRSSLINKLITLALLLPGAVLMIIHTIKELIEICKEIKKLKKKK